MEILLIMAGIAIGLVALGWWGAHKDEEISGFYNEDENDPYVETLLHTDQMKGNSM